MATVVQNLRHTALSCKFSLNYKAGSICKTAPFNLSNHWKNCQLTLSVLSCERDNYISNNTYDANLTLELGEDNSLDQYKKFNFCVSFGKKKKFWYIFETIKIQDNKYYAQSPIEDRSIPNLPVYAVHFRIRFPNYYELRRQYPMMAGDSDSDSDVLPENNNENSNLMQMKNDMLMKNMNDILLNETYSDVKLVADDKIFNVHKIILYTRNIVFARMIEDMVKKKTDSIYLPGWDPVVVQELLKYLYIDKCDLTKNPCDLFKLAHFLQIDELQKMCQDYLMSNIQVKNLTEILELTKQSEYKLYDLKKAADKFIEDNESILKKVADFKDNYRDSINFDNVIFVFKFSRENGVEDLLTSAIKFICSNYKEFLKEEKNKKFLALDSDLMSRVFEYLLDNHKV